VPYKILKNGMRLLVRPTRVEYAAWSRVIAKDAPTAIPAGAFRSQPTAVTVRHQEEEQANQDRLLEDPSARAFLQSLADLKIQKMK
jgi:hypothetical protein